MSKKPILFCTQCGAPVERKIPEGDDHERYVCTACGEIFYENPLNIVGTVPVWEDKVLLCRRAIEPRKGYWTLPAGHQEMKETTRDGAARETREEAGIDFRIADEPYVYLDLAHASQSHVIFLAAMESPEANPGPESFEARLFSEDEIPWDKIAFNSVDKILRLYFDEAKTGNFPFHYIERHKQGKIP